MSVRHLHYLRVRPWNSCPTAHRTASFQINDCNEIAEVSDAYIFV